MDTLIYHWFVDQLTEANLRANLIVSLNLIGALALGFVVGYERSYHGRAAGMRTYGLMCMAAAALTMVSGHPEFWYRCQKIAVTAAPAVREFTATLTWLSVCRCDHERRPQHQRVDHFRINVGGLSDRHHLGAGAVRHRGAAGRLVLAVHDVGGPPGKLVALPACHCGFNDLCQGDKT